MKIQFKPCLIALLLCLFSLQANAHEIWLGRDGQGPVRVYFGHYGGEVEKTGGRLDAIKADNLVPKGVISRTARREDHIELTLAPVGDVALTEAMNPRKSRTAEEIIRTVFLARHGNSEVI